MLRRYFITSFSGAVVHVDVALLTALSHYLVETFLMDVVFIGFLTHGNETKFT